MKKMTNRLLSLGLVLIAVAVLTIPALAADAVVDAAALGQGVAQRRIFHALQHLIDRGHRHVRARGAFLQERNGIVVHKNRPPFSNRMCRGGRSMLYYTKKGGLTMIFERTVKEIRGDYAVLVGESGVETEVALALLPDGVREGMVLICENFEYRIK